VNRILKSGQYARSASALLLSALIIFISLLSVSPSLHKWLHADADAADHSCAITLFAKGQIDEATITPVVAGLVMLFGGIALLLETFQFPLANYRFSRGRAPPVLRSSCFA
jgi:hypothetical protein